MSSPTFLALKDLRKANGALLEEIVKSRESLLHTALTTPYLSLPKGPFKTAFKAPQSALGEVRAARLRSHAPQILPPPKPLKSMIWQFVKGEFIEKQTPKTPLIGVDVKLEAKLKPYSQAEHQLSSLSEQLARALVQAFAKNLEGSPFSALINYTPALEIRFDDPFFTALNPLYALAEQLKTHKSILLLTQDLLLLHALAHLLAHLNPKLKIYAPLELDVESLDLLTLTSSHSKPDFTALEALKTPLIASSVTKTWIMGRPQDRNYVTDIHALLYEFPKASFFPTALREQQASPYPNSHPFPEEIMRRFAPNHFRNISDYWGESFVDKLVSKLSPLENALLLWQEKLTRSLCRKILPASLLALDYLHRAFERDRPQRIICLPSRDWLARAACLIGKEKGSVSFDVQTVFVGPRSRYKRSFATYQMAIETHSASLYRDYFITPKEKVILAGGVRYGLVRRAVIKARIEGKPLKFCFSHRVLFAASPFYESCAPVLQALVQALLPFKESGLLLRLHPTSPKEHEAQFKELLLPLQARATLLHAPLAETLASSDLVVTRYSNVGLEAAMAYIPVIACDLSNERPPIPLDDMGIALRAQCPQSLQNLIQEFIFKKEAYVSLLHRRNAYLSKNAQLLHENPSFNLSQTILELS